MSWLSGITFDPLYHQSFPDFAGDKIAVDGFANAEKYRKMVDGLIDIVRNWHACPARSAVATALGHFITLSSRDCFAAEDPAAVTALWARLFDERGLIDPAWRPLFDAAWHFYLQK